jgi:nucleotide-binding universal stress UspA family protein
MKQIVVAVDFSKNSIHALEYAVTFAAAIKGAVTMVWVDKPESEDSLYENETSEYRSEAKSRMEELVKEYSKKLNGNISYKLRKGKIYKEIANQAKYSDAYIIIAGSHGVSGFEAFWIGSNANKIVTYSPCPVLTIRVDFTIKKGIKKIVLPIDNTSTTRQKVPFTVELAKLFKSEVHILELQSSTLKSVRAKVNSYTKQVEEYLTKNDVKFITKEIDTENITTSTVNYAEESNADLIVIMTEQDTSNVWLGKYAQQMVNNSQVPILTVHPKEIEFLAK